MKVSFVLTYLLLPFALAAQLTLEIPAADSKFSDNNFTVTQITDSVGTSYIGKIYDKSDKKQTTVRLTRPPADYFTALLEKNVTSPPDAHPIELVISGLSIPENKNGEVISGQLMLTVDFYSIKNNQRYFLTSATGKQAYQRTAGAVSARSFEQLVWTATRNTLQYLSQWITLNQAVHPAFVTVSSVVILPDYARNDEDTIYHVTRPITWDDFRGRPANASSRFDAAIFANIAFSLEITINDNQIQAQVTPKVYMVRGMSWVHQDRKNAYSLKHEQLHFDIAQVAMNRFCQRIKILNETTPEDLQSRIQYEYLEAYREMNRLQDAYDEDTAHGQLFPEQAAWEEKIKGWLLD